MFYTRDFLNSVAEECREYDGCPDNEEAGSYQREDMLGDSVFARVHLDVYLECGYDRKTHTQLQPLQERGILELPVIPEGCIHNGHMYYAKAKDMEERTRLLAFLKENGILSVFHYVPLHTAPAGLKFGEFRGEDIYTTKESERLFRLPLFFTLKESEVDYIVSKIKEFYGVSY